MMEMSADILYKVVIVGRVFLYSVICIMVVLVILARKELYRDLIACRNDFNDLFKQIGEFYTKRAMQLKQRRTRRDD